MDDTLIPAATILIVRDVADDAGMEIFMVKRHHQIDFASGALVFPGGKIDHSDYADELRGYCADTAELSDSERHFRLGAIREAYEECGILLARRRGSRQLISGDELASLTAWRDRFNAHDTDMLEFARTAELEFACDLLEHFGHWITPEMMPKRFDTHFFLARAPSDQLAIHDGHESVDSVWIKPGEALVAAEAGTHTIIFPTRMNLVKLNQHIRIDDALAACGTVRTVTPWIEKEGERHYLRIQADAGYGDPREDVTRGL